MAQTPPVQPDNRPSWCEGKTINEATFCHAFLAQHRLAHTENAFFTPEGRVTDVTLLKEQIFRMLEPYATTSVTKKISNIIELLKITANTDQLLPQTDRIHLANGTLFLDGRFSTVKDEIVRSRLPIQYNPDAAPPEGWLSFLDQLLYPEDIVTLQEFFGYGYNKGEDGNLEVNPEQAVVVERIYDLYLEGHSFISIVDKLAEDKVPSPQGKEKWSKRAIETVLSNMKYTGNVKILNNDPNGRSYMLVWTPDGPVPIEDLKDGDRIVSFNVHTGMVTGYRDGVPVKTASRHYSGKIYGIRASGKQTWVTDNHQFFRSLQS